jgi:NADH-quinone oxidoreductase subunit C
MAETSQAIVSLNQAFPDRIGAPVLFRGESTVTIAKADIPAVAAHLLGLGFRFLIDISSVDHFGEEPRYEMVYEFYDLDANASLRVKARVSEDDLTVPTLIRVYQTADWHEREVYDMMGIVFTGHPDLRRILMWEGYPYFPLRKDFPLEGKSSDEGGTAFSRPAPLEGGPFVTSPASLSQDREPRAHPASIS